MLVPLALCNCKLTGRMDSRTANQAGATASIPSPFEGVSIEDAKIPRLQDHSSSSSDDPSSPKVSCIGQVKRNNKLITAHSRIHATTTTTIPKVPNHHNGHIKYAKLKKLFSGKNLITTTASRCSTNSSRREMIRCGSTTRPRLNHDNENQVPVNVAELDPPLPVIVKVKELGGGRDEVNLWKRRSGFIALKTLQVQQFHVPTNNHVYFPPTTV